MKPRQPIRRKTPLKRGNWKPVQRARIKRTRIKLRFKPTRETKDGRLIQSPRDWAITRERIFERDKGICQITGLSLTRDNYSVDHKKKRKMGGGFREDRDSNLRLAHPVANQLRETGLSDKQIRAKLLRMAKNYLDC